MPNLYTLTFRKMDKNKSIEENFIEALDQERNAQRIYFKGINIYYHLFNMLHFYAPNFMTEIVEQYKNSSDWWFYNFHKQFRQVDMYSGIGFFDRKISKEDNEKRNNLLRERYKYISENKPRYKDFEDKDEWYEKEKEFYDTDEFLKENRAEMLPLNRAFNAYERKENFGGHMDSIMWLTISNDTENSLYRFLDEFLAMYFNVTSYEEKRLFPEEDGK